MRLARDGIEFAHYVFTGAPTDAAPPQIELNGVWLDMEWVDFAGDEREARILVGGPASTPIPGAVKLTAGRKQPRVRLVDTPEIVVRDATGTIDVEG